MLAVVALVLVSARAALPSGVRWYVNRVLDQNQVYDGIIGDVDIHLWRGAYSVEHIRLVKTTGSVPVPLFETERLDLAVEWSSLLRGKVVGRMVLDKPILNFVDAEDDSEDQAGGGGPWLKIVQELFPFSINTATVKDGVITFRTFDETPVDVYLSDVQGSVENLTNIHDEVAPMFATVKARALAMNHAGVEFSMVLDPSSYRPTFTLAMRLLGLDLTKINSLARSYGEFDFEHGWFDLVIEMEAKEGRVDGTVKPLFRNVQVVDLREDAKDGNLFNVFWEAVVGVASEILENQPRAQVATLIPFSGDMTDTRTDLLATVGNLLRNAFVRAYLPRFELEDSGGSALTFAPAREIEARPNR